MTVSEIAWRTDKRRNNWELPAPVARWKRLPIVRQIRVIWHANKIGNNSRIMGSLGFVDSGYDEWVLYAILRGWY